MEILAPRHPRTSKKQGNGEADGGGQVSHMKSLAESGIGANTLVGAPSVSCGVGGSLLDVQSLARHSSLQMTQRYIEVSEDAMKKVVG